jgi:hypothetical protein
MFSSVFKEVTGILDRRFLLNAFFPSLLFWSLLVAVGLAEQGLLLQITRAWDQQDIIVKLLQIVGFIAWVTFFAGIVSSQVTTILRLYEGYWHGPFSHQLRIIGQRWHQDRLAQLNPYNDADYEAIYHTYPLPTRMHEVMPTRLGNILKNAELYPRLRYKLDPVLIWPRLYNVVPERFIATIAETRGALDFMLVLSALSALFAIFAGGHLLIVGGTWWLFLACFWGGMGCAWIAYRSAIGSASLYAEQIKVGFDLYRNDLLKQMRLPLPITPEEERTLWSDVGQFLYRNIHEHPAMWMYVASAPESNDDKPSL